MHVYDAVSSRRAVRAFTDRPVPAGVLRRVLTAAGRAPSGSNLQPWNSYLLTGASLAEVKKRVAERLAAGDPGEAAEFDICPPELPDPYRRRRHDAGEQRYTAQGIGRDDRQGRAAAVAANWDCFGAPAALFCYLDRGMGAAQWADVGMYLQTVMLLLRAEGLHSCPQKAWPQYRGSVAAVVAPPPELMMFCGLSIGYEDTSAPFARIDRAPLAETVTFLD